MRRLKEAYIWPKIMLQMVLAYPVLTTTAQLIVKCIYLKKACLSNFSTKSLLISGAKMIVINQISI